MPEYSGIAGIVPRATPTEPPVGDQIANFAERILQIKTAQKQQAMAQLQGAVQMASSFGFMMDPKKLQALVKKSGLPISMKEEDLAAGVLANKTSKAGAGGGGGAGGASAQPGGSPSASGPGVQAQPPAGQPQPQAGKRPSTTEIVNQMADSALKRMNLQGATDSQKADNAFQVQKLKAQVIEGGPEGDRAFGSLVRLGEMKFDVNAEQYAKMTPEQRGRWIDIAAGAMTPAQHSEQATKIGDNLIATGRFKDPQDAYRAGRILEEGGQLPQELKANMRPYSFSEMADQAKLGESLVQMGIPADKIPSTMRKAETGGIMNALPSNMKPIAIEQLKIERERAESEEVKNVKELDIARRMDIAAESKAMSDEKKADLDTFKSLVEMKKAGGSVSDDLLKGAQIKAADALNMDVTEVKHWWQYATGGTYLKFTPRLTPGGSATVNKFAGSPMKKGSPNAIEKIGGAFKKMTGDQGPI